MKRTNTFAVRPLTDDDEVVLGDGGDETADVGRLLDGIQMPPVTAIEPRQAGHAVVTQGNELREVDAHVLVVPENLPQDEHVTRDGELRDDDTHR